MSGIAVALISGGCSIIVGGLSLIGIIITNNKSNADMQHKITTAQAVTDTKIEELTREVREHNDFAKRIPVMEAHIKGIEDKINIYHRPPPLN